MIKLSKVLLLLFAIGYTNLNLVGQLSVEYKLPFLVSQEKNEVLLNSSGIIDRGSSLSFAISYRHDNNMIFGFSKLSFDHT